MDIPGVLAEATATCDMRIDAEGLSRPRICNASEDAEEVASEKNGGEICRLTDADECGHPIVMPSYGVESELGSSPVVGS